MVQAADERTPLKDDGDPKLLRNPIRWFQRLSDGYSWQMLVTVIVGNHVLKGFVAGGGDDGFIGRPVEFIFAAYGVVAGRLQVLRAVALMPWALKPLVGIFQDTVPFFGYRRMPYLVVTSVIAVCAALCLGFRIVDSLPLVVACLFLLFLQVATFDLAIEAQASEKVKEAAELGPDFFTFIWLGIVAAQMIGIVLVGWVIQALGPWMCYLVAAPFCAFVLWPTLMNYLGEKRLPDGHSFADLDRVYANPVLISLTLLVGVVVLILMVGAFTFSKNVLFATAVAMAVLLLSGFGLLLRPEISYPLLFFFILNAAFLNVDGALFYFFTADSASFPEGPHFSAMFYVTGLGFATMTGVLLGYVSGNALFSSWSYRGIVILSIGLRVCARLLLVPVLLRWTLSMGIPDVLWLVVTYALEALFSSWQWIPKQVMQAQLSPHGVEAMVQGLSAGALNLGALLGSFYGSYLLHSLNIKPSGQPGESEMYMEVWKAQVVAAVLPLVLLCLVPVFITSKSQMEILLEEEVSSATHGSLFERLRSGRSPSEQQP